MIMILQRGEASYMLSRRAHFYGDRIHSIRHPGHISTNGAQIFEHYVLTTHEHTTSTKQEQIKLNI
ncbi:MAG: hypothetical protein AAGJ68_14815 [Pseudomonadota bacterium]